MPVARSILIFIILINVLSFFKFKLNLYVPSDFGCKNYNDINLESSTLQGLMAPSLRSLSISLLTS